MWRVMAGQVIRRGCAQAEAGYLSLARSQASRETRQRLHAVLGDGQDTRVVNEYERGREHVAGTR